MRKLFCGILGFAFLCAPVIAFAHPASDIKFDYNAGEKTLKITVIHGSRDISKHFIDTINVTIDGMKMIEQTFMSQFDAKGQEVSYIVIDVKEKSKVKVDTHCCKGGDLSKEILIEG